MSQTHNEYFIEKEQLPVEVTMVTGEELSGSLFVQPTWRRPSIEFDAPVLLNLPDGYVPLQLANGRTRLIAKSHLVLLRGTNAETANGVEELGDPAPVVMRCSNGIIVRGNLMIARITSNTRVLDYLNRSAEEFILLHESDGVVLVNRSHIVVVHDESDAAA
ncbi:MAG TPA: hypothetical protein VF128_12545 [Gemmatimonadaceae bacterium]